MKQETLEQAAKNHINNDLDLYESLVDGHISYDIGKDLLNNLFINGAKWQQDMMLKFILDEDNHTEGELGNSSIDVQTLVHFIEQFKNK